MRRRLPAHFFIGALGLVGSMALLFARVEPVYTSFYSFAWWSYILLIDGLVYRRQGDSMLMNRRWELLVLSFWSIACWNVYEVFNFRLHNWYYVMTPVGGVTSFLHSQLAFATVLPGVFQTTELLGTIPFFDRLRIRPQKIGPRVLGFVFVVGIVCTALPVLWPKLFFPFVWGCAVFVLEPIVYLAGGRSLLRDMEAGRPGRFVRLWCAGFIVGGLWEFWNFWTRTKWIYTVPGFESVKLFEMPILGFVGFPPFVIECWVMYAFIGLFRRNRGWERYAYRVPHGAPRWLAVTGVAAAFAFNLAVNEGIGRYTVASTNPMLADVPGVTPTEAHRLRAAGLRRPPDLLVRARREGLAALAGRTGLREKRLRDIDAACDLIELKGLGVDYYRLLRDAGIGTVGDLAEREASDLTETLARIAAVRGVRAPYEAQVSVWVRAARRREANSGPDAVDRGVAKR